MNIRDNPVPFNIGEGATRAFTLMEIMVVVGVMGVLLAMGIPSIVKSVKREGMRKAVNDLTEVCNTARARAIFNGTPTEVVFHPLEKRFEVGGAMGGSTVSDGNEELEERRPPPADSGLAGQFPDQISIEMLDINLSEYRESELARVRFFPNGTSDEMTLILRSDRNEYRKVWLEVTTGLVDWGEVQ
jgi:prepilin-type N-terminal cleavage/methylation domain-containing protein